jgi:hypothetical protein
VSKVLQSPVQRFKNSKRKEWSQRKAADPKMPSSVFQLTQYYCRKRQHPQQSMDPFSAAPATSLTSSGPSSAAAAASAMPFVLQSINASALLSPREYCAKSAKSALTHNVSRSINGTDAARRLLRGKKDFFMSARQMVNGGVPLMLVGHTVPLQLLQHCVDMADQLLRHYGPDVEECSFHNYHPHTSRNNVALPLRVRIRQRNGSTAVELPPRDYESSTNSGYCIDWDHHLELYLTVMQNFANPLGKIFECTASRGKESVAKRSTAVADNIMTTTQYNGVNDTTTTKTTTKSNRPRAIDEYRFDNDDDEHDFTASPLLFDSPPPRWNVEIMKGAVYDLRPVVGNDSNDDDDDDDTMIGTVTDRRDKNNADLLLQQSLFPPPFPIVEFMQDGARSPGHVLIRLQGIPRPNHYFAGSTQRRPQPVTLVFDAGYYPSPSMAYNDSK